MRGGVRRNAQVILHRANARGAPSGTDDGISFGTRADDAIESRPTVFDQNADTMGLALGVTLERILDGRLDRRLVDL